jgi:catechol 2,3-dioxygenase-like lactoylglutathione lyase family enzyme
MQVRHIDHVQLAMPAGREDEARAFYRDVLGISEIAKPSHLAVRGGVDGGVNPQQSGEI